MIRKLLLLLFLAPVFELLFLVWLNNGAWSRAAFGIALASAGLGVWIISRGGMQTARRMRSDMQGGHPPAQSLVDGLCRFLAGVLLIVPSVTTDLVGLALLFPLTRRLIQAWFAWKVLGKMNVSFSGFSSQDFSSAGAGGRMGAGPSDDSDVIDVDVVPSREPPRHLPR